MFKRTIICSLGLLAVVVAMTSVGAASAQAKYLILLNGQSVSSMEMGVKFFEGRVTAENGLEIHCEGGEGSGSGGLVEGGLRVVGSGAVTFEGCVWVGAEETCVINDEGEGIINTSGSGEIETTEEGDFIATSTSEEYATIYTEGIFCTLPEEEVVSGSVSVILTEALSDLKRHTGELGEMDLYLGNSKIVESEATAEGWDLNDSDATFAIHAIEL